MMPDEPVPSQAGGRDSFLADRLANDAAEVVTTGEAAWWVNWASKPASGGRLRIVDGPGMSVRIVGNDERGCSTASADSCEARAISGGSLPAPGGAPPCRAVRCAVSTRNHFNNYYEALRRELERYVEDLSLWVSTC